MKPIDLLGKLIFKLPEIIEAVGTLIERAGKATRRMSGRPPAPDLPHYSPPYQDEHSWTRFGPHLPPQHCIWCKQPRTTASRYCPGMPKDS